MCTVQHVETKSAFTFQPIKRLVSTTVKSAKHAARFWIFFLRSENQQLCCLVVMEHIAFYERRVATTKKKSHLHFWRNFCTNHNQAHSNLNQERTNWVQLWNKPMRFLLVDDLSIIFFFSNLFFHFQPTVHQPNLFNLQSTYRKNHDLLSLKRRNPVDSPFWTRLCYHCRKWSPQKYNNQFTRNTPLSWQLLLAQRQEFLNNHLARVPITLNQEGTMEMRDEVLSSVGGSRAGH